MGLSEENVLSYNSDHSSQVLCDVIRSFTTESVRDSRHFLYAYGVTENIRFFIERIANKDESQRVISKFLKDQNACNHGRISAVSAVLIALAMGMRSDKFHSMVAIAGLLHDVALTDEEVVIQSENAIEMTHEQRLIYLAHPLKGAEIVRGIRGIDGLVVQAIAQHHERSDGRGFPRRLENGTMNMMSEIIGVSDEFAKFAQGITRKNLQFDKFSRPVLNAFRLVFRGDANN